MEKEFEELSKAVKYYDFKYIEKGDQVSQMNIKSKKYDDITYVVKLHDCLKLYVYQGRKNIGYNNKGAYYNDVNDHNTWENMFDYFKVIRYDNFEGEFNIINEKIKNINEKYGIGNKD